MVDVGVRYGLKTVKAMRGTEGRSSAKWHKEGWESVDQSAGTLYTTLNSRKPKPPLPMRQIVIGGAVALSLAGIIGVGALLEANGGGKDSQAADPTPVATEQSDSPPPPVAIEQPDSPPMQITDIKVDEQPDKLNSAT